MDAATAHRITRCRSYLEEVNEPAVVVQIAAGESLKAGLLSRMATSAICPSCESAEVEEEWRAEGRFLIAVLPRTADGENRLHYDAALQRHGLFDVRNANSER